MNTGISADKVNDARYIPWLIVAFFVVITCVLAGFAYVAITTYRGVVTDQAYERGVAYNAVIARAEEQAARGWNADIVFRDGYVTFTLVDGDGTAVAADGVVLVMFRPTQAGMDRRYDMQSLGGGRFQANVSDLPAHGAWDARVTAQTIQGDYHASTRMVIE